MSNVSSVPALRNPLRSLQQGCVALLASRRRHAADGDAAASRQAVAAFGDDDGSTQWEPTTWSDTCLEPRMP